MPENVPARNRPAVASRRSASLTMAYRRYIRSPTCDRSASSPPIGARRPARGFARRSDGSRGGSVAGAEVLGELLIPDPVDARQNGLPGRRLALPLPQLALRRLPARGSPGRSRSTCTTTRPSVGRSPAVCASLSASGATRCPSVSPGSAIKHVDVVAIYLVTSAAQLRQRARVAARLPNVIESGAASTQRA